MHSVLFASLRLTIAIVCIGLSLVLAGQWFNFFDHPLQMIGFYVVTGIAVYWIFVLYVMQEFEFSRVAPDRVREALDTLSEGLLVMDERDCIVLANDSFSRMVGIEQSELLGRRADSLAWVCSSKSGGDEFPWQRAIHLDQPQIEQLMRYRLPDQTLRFFSINASSVIREDATQRGSLATFRDVTESEVYRAQRERTLAMLRTSRDEMSSQNRQLQILASQDSLTGCLNRRAFGEAFEKLWGASLQSGNSIACLMFDNDHFKSVNDRFGHPIGDEVLRRVSAILKERFHLPALVCRYGGEEFCVVLPETSLESAVDAGEDIRKSIEAARIEEVPELLLTASIGVSETRHQAPNPQALIAQADEALYIAKGSGRNRVVAYKPPE